MEPRFIHGNITPQDLSRALLAEFNRGHLHAQQLGTGDKLVVQIATHRRSGTGGQTAVSVSLQKHEDGVMVQLGEQSWWGIAGSLGQTALAAWHSPWRLINRLDDLAQDIESLQLEERIWNVINQTVYAAGASYELSERFRRIVCSYCRSANPPGEPGCIACGAPLGESQLQACTGCGFLVESGETVCPNCGIPTV